MVSSSAGALERALSFNLHDLADNRRGVLSPAQQTRLSVQRHLLMGCTLLGGIVAAALLLAFASGFQPLALGVILVSSAGLFVALGRGIAQNNSVRGKVVLTHGVLHKSIERSEETYWYHVLIGSARFNVNPAAFEAFTEGARYTLYHLEGSPVILSAEAH